MCLLAPTTKALESSAGSILPLSRGYKLDDTGIVNIIIIIMFEWGIGSNVVTLAGHYIYSARVLFVVLFHIKSANTLF